MGSSVWLRKKEKKNNVKRRVEIEKSWGGAGLDRADPPSFGRLLFTFVPLAQCGLASYVAMYLAAPLSHFRDLATGRVWGTFWVRVLSPLCAYVHM
jgi:hypothetical protein